MSKSVSRKPTLARLSACVALAFGIDHGAQAAATLLVTNCTDTTSASASTLRHSIAAASSGDTVLIQAGTCSKITIDGGSQIVVPVTNLTIQGPGADQLTIDGGAALSPNQYHRIFAHGGSGTLTISGMTLTEGKYQGNSFPIGGCIYSAGNVSVQYSTITNCFLNPPAATTTINSRGAAIYAKGTVTLNHATISSNLITTVGSAKKAVGVGIYSGSSLIALNSTITGNFPLPASSSGGGAYVKSGALILSQSTVSHNSAGRGAGLFQASGGTGATIKYSTISNNTGTDNGGFELRAVDQTKTATILDSTISGNVVTGFQAGGGTYFPTKVYNSTIAFNRAGTSNFAVGLYSSKAITMQSSIFANNTGTGAYDVGSHATMVLIGSDNLITATTNAVPLGTISTCPKLEPLADNGGPTLTHKLQSTSAAIDQGNLTGGSLSKDQRLAARSVGGGVDMGSYERQASETADDRVFYSEFESACD